MTDAMGNNHICRGQSFPLTFVSGGIEKTIHVPVYEMRFGSWPAGYMIIGRTILNVAEFCYDGRNRKATLTFADDSPLTLG
jgi:hypothetical protein